MICWPITPSERESQCRVLQLVQGESRPEMNGLSARSLPGMIPRKRRDQEIKTEKDKKAMC